MPPPSRCDGHHKSVFRRAQELKYETGLNPQDRKSLGLTMPLPLLGRADQVIEWRFAACLKWGRVKTPAPAARVETSRRKCASRELNHAAHIRFDAVLENRIFHISPMYEFSHSQGQKLKGSP